MKLALGLGLFAFGCFVVGGCGDDDNGGGPYENAGSACASVNDCYPNVEDTTAILGEVQCLSKVPGGYCTHLCNSDSDCCATPGECTSGHPQVCSPFENQPQKYCFLSCEDADWKAAGSVDANDYCYYFANTGFTCHSSGGGSQNRKICSP